MAEQQTTTPNHLQTEAIYLKNLSFVSPKAGEDEFTGTPIEMLLNIRSGNSGADADRTEVTLTLGVKGVIESEPIFEIEVVQAGLFRLSGFSPEQRLQILGRVCPEILFPYARTAIDDITRKGGFRNMLLKPLDFHELFAQNMREWTARAAES